MILFENKKQINFLTNNTSHDDIAVYRECDVQVAESYKRTVQPVVYSYQDVVCFDTKELSLHKTMRTSFVELCSGDYAALFFMSKNCSPRKDGELQLEADGMAYWERTFASRDTKFYEAEFATDSDELCRKFSKRMNTANRRKNDHLDKLWDLVESYLKEADKLGCKALVSFHSDESRTGTAANFQRLLT